MSIDFKARRIASEALTISEGFAEDINDVKRIQETVFEPTGFSFSQDLTNNTTEYVNLNFDNSNRTFSISPIYDNYNIISSGVFYTKTEIETVQISNTDGLHFIYFDNNGDLKSSESLEFFNDGHVAISYIYWNVSSQKAVIFGLETHGAVMDWATHLYNHESNGVKYINGLLAGNYTLVGDGSSNADAQLSISNGQIDDEDLRYFITHSATPTNFGEQKLSTIAEIPIMYRNGVGGVWTIDNATQYPVKQGTARIKYNLNTAGTWTTPDVDADDKYIAMWIFATNNKTPIVAILGQRVDGTPEDAKANNTFSGIDFGDIPFVEFKSLWRLIFKTNSTYANTPKAVLIDVESLLNIGAIQISAINTTNHNTLTNRNAINSHPASALSFNNIPSEYESTQVQDVIDEIIDKKLELSGGQLTGIVKDASFIEFPNDGNPLISHFPTVAHTITHMWSSGKVHGFEISDNGDGTISLDSGDIFLRDLDTSAPLGNLKEYHVSPTANISLADNSVNYICANYNNGSPSIHVETDLSQISGRMMVMLYIVTRIGTQLYYYDVGNYSTDFDVKYAKKIVSQKNFEYGGNGAKITEVGNRKLNITESAFYYINERIETPSFDTSNSDVFKYVYKNASNGWTRVEDQTTIDNTNYNNESGTLSEIPSGKYVVNWIYLVLDTPTELYVKYPTLYHDTVAEAKVESIPSILPPELQSYSTGILIGKIILQKGSLKFTEINDPFTQQFWTTSPTTHNRLAGLNEGEYMHLNSSQFAIVQNTSGINTGDQTNITGNAGTATKMATPRNINGVAFDGTANITIVDSTKEPILTKGDLTGTNVSVTGGTGAVIGSGVAVSIPQSVATTASPTFANITTTGHSYVSIGTTTITNGTINDLVLPDTDVVFITSSTGNATISGIAGGVAGKILRIVYTGTNNITFSNQNSGSIAANRLNTLGSNFATNGPGSVSFLYNGSGWYLLGGVS